MSTLYPQLTTSKTDLSSGQLYTLSAAMKNSKYNIKTRNSSVPISAFIQPNETRILDGTRVEWIQLVQGVIYYTTGATLEIKSSRYWYNSKVNSDTALYGRVDAGEQITAPAPTAEWTDWFNYTVPQDSNDTMYAMLESLFVSLDTVGNVISSGYAGMRATFYDPIANQTLNLLEVRLYSGANYVSDRMIALNLLNPGEVLNFQYKNTTTVSVQATGGYKGTEFY